jgi:glycosyltransferase involved in cell wall biosynthesis
MAASILFLGTQMTVGGAQRLLFIQAEWFYQQGYDVTAAFFYDKDHLKDEWQAAYPFEVVDLRSWRQGAPAFIQGLSLLAGTFRLWRLLLRKKIDVIETFTPDSNVIGLFAARIAGVPVRIATHHGYVEGAGEWRKTLHGWMVNHGFCQHLVAVSERVKRMAVDEEGVKPERVVVIMNGIDVVKAPDQHTLQRLRVALDVKKDDFIYLTVGRLTVQKGHIYLLEAIPEVLQRYPDSTLFLVAGEGHQRDILENRVSQLGLGKFVRFLGNRSDIPALLSIADVFVLPSLWEGLPLALLEAMSVGLPVVATQVEGVDSVVTEGENGYLVPPKDSQALALALIKIREYEEARHSFSKKNTEDVERQFTIERMCSHYESLFLDGRLKDIAR